MAVDYRCLNMKLPEVREASGRKEDGDEYGVCCKNEEEGRRESDNHRLAIK